ncbi:hypothetical protein GCM10010377_48810 [Streptomyces viridiviolaceus]|nr:hypothetical protein GCM10010377_48810 [Streptomyces viridiviolaceus]
MQDLFDHALLGWMRDAEATDGETWTAFSERAAAEPTASLGRGRDAAVVTSGGLPTALCSALLSLPREGVVSLNRVTVDASVTALAAGASGTTPLTFDDHAHLVGDRSHMRTYR